MKYVTLAKQLAGYLIVVVATVGIIYLPQILEKPTTPNGPGVFPVPNVTPLGPSENVAKAIVVSPATAKIGELVRLDATGSLAASYKWLAPTGDFEVIDGGRKAVFSARKEGTYQFTLAVALRDTLDVATFTVVVQGAAPTPTNESLESWIPYWKAEMDLPKDKLEALAASFEKVSLQMITLGTPEKIIAETARANREALGSDLPKFVPLMQKIQASLEKLARSGTMKTPEQHAAVWQEVARGLRK